MESYTLEARAKINLTLDVTGRRADGYHDVRMIMQTVAMHDSITLKITDKRGIRLTCDNGALPLEEGNLAYRAAALFLDEIQAGCGVNIDIRKEIPIAAGLAGGSSDAAAVLKGLNLMLEAGLDEDRLCRLGCRLGADVPYCIRGGTMLAEGIGEILTRLPAVPVLDILLVKPHISVSTPWVYKNLKLDEIALRPDTDLAIKAIANGNTELLAENMINVLETVTIKEYDIIRQIKNHLLELGAAGALMSGSGPTVFGLFRDRPSAERAYDKMDRKLLDCFLTTTV